MPNFIAILGGITHSFIALNYKIVFQCNAFQGNELAFQTIEEDNA